MKSFFHILLLFLTTLIFSCKEDNKPQPPVNTNTDSTEWYSEAKFTSLDITNDVVYGVDSEHHYMRVFEPSGDEREKRPLLLLLGGGAFQGSNLDLLTPVAKEVCKYGFVVAAVRYRSGPSDPGLEAQTMMIKGQQDNRACIRYFKANAAKWRIDSNLIFNGGNGTGAFLALFTTYVDEDEIDASVKPFIDSLGGLEGSQGHPGYSSNIKGVVSLAGGMYQSIDFIKAGEPPIFAVHGTADTEVPYDQKTEGGSITYGSKAITEKAASVGIEQKLVLLDGGGHAAPRSTSPIYIEALMKFLKERIEE